MAHPTARCLSFSALVALAACSASDPDGVFADNGTPKAGSTGASAGRGGAAASAGGGGSSGGSDGGIVITPEPGTSSCGAAGDYVFVISSEYELLRFLPQTGAFELIGKVACPTKDASATPFSMAVDRGGRAWVNFTGGFDAGAVFLVDTKTAKCAASPFDRAYASGKNWKNFGMAFVSDTAGSESEHLYLADATSFAVGVLGKDKGLARVNADSGKIEPVGQFSNQTIVQRGGLDLSGRGDGKLFAFVVDGSGQGSPLVAEIGKEDGAILSTAAQTALPNKINAWAFAHWGGSLYLFHATTGVSGGMTQVTRYTPGEGSELFVKNSKYRIVGAGVSTCAPILPPPK